MNDNFLIRQKILLQNRERIFSEIKKYPNVIQVGVGLKEVNNEFTSVLCYRVYVSEKKSSAFLKEEEKIPAIINDFVTDVIEYGIIEGVAVDNTHYRPLTGGIQIKNSTYNEKDKRGVGTLGCLAIANGTGKTVGLTCEHVVKLNSQANSVGKEIGQPFKVICCRFFIKNIIGKVIDAKNNSEVDCAIIELHNDIINEITSGHTINEIIGIGYISGTVNILDSTDPVLKTVIKRGAATGITKGKIVDIAFDGNQLLISPLPPNDTFADFGDSGSLVLTEDTRAVGLLWGTKRDRFTGDKTVPDEDSRDLLHQTTPFKHRVYGVASPIHLVETALNIKIPVPPQPLHVPSFSVHPDDIHTHVIDSIIPGSAKKHFVTVKKGEVNNEIPDDIILKVSFAPALDANELTRLDWNSDNEKVKIIYPGVGTDKLTARISRKIAHGEKVMIGVTINGIGHGEKIFLWIVWSTPTKFQMQQALDENGEPMETIDAQGRVNPVFHKYTITSAEIKYEVSYSQHFIIEPSEIFPKVASDEAPDLTGKNITDPPDVSDTDVDVFQKGVSLKGGAAKKWDASRSMRCKVLGRGFFMPPVGKYNQQFPNYPSLAIVGNDDTSVSQVESVLTPYETLDTVHGRLLYGNEIVHILSNSLGNSFTPNDESVVDFRINYRLFARLELGGKWYMISEFAPWRVEWAYIKAKEYTDENGVKFLDVWTLKGSIGVVDDSNVNFDDPFP